MPLDPLFPDYKPKENESLLTGPGAKLIKITQGLTDIIKRETDLMVARKTQAAGHLHGEKSRLIAEYRNTLNHIQVNSHLLGEAESPIRTKIKEVTDNFRNELRNHARVVLRLKTITEGIVKSVGEEIAKRDQPVMGYGSNASLKAPNPLRPTSLSLNQTI